MPHPRLPAAPSVRDFFDQDAARYLGERYVLPTCDQLAYLNRRRLALELLDTTRGRIIDIGGGPGPMMEDLLSRGFSVVELDLSREMLLQARLRIPPDPPIQVRLVQASLPDIPFRVGAFDAALCVGVLAYLDRPEDTLLEIRRVLKPGGLALIQVSNIFCPTARLHSLLRKAYRTTAEVLGGPSYPHLRMRLKAFSFASSRRMLANASFSLESWAFYDFRPPLIQWLSPALARRMTARLQGLERTNALGWLAEGIVLKARAC